MTQLLVTVLLPHVSAGGTNDFGESFLQEKRAESDVVELPSGLLYKVLHAGDGEKHARQDSRCSCHYEGRTAEAHSQEPKGRTVRRSSAVVGHCTALASHSPAPLFPISQLAPD